MPVPSLKTLEGERRRLDHYLEATLAPKSGDPPEISVGARYAVLSGGKRIRPLLLLHVYRLGGGRGSRALPAAAAIELIHAFSLVQDDLPSMDDDDTRRGRPTLHKAHGEANALLVSDYLLLRALQLVAENYPPGMVSTVIEGIGPRGLIGGQVLDLAWQGREIPPETADVIRLRKTAALFELSFRLGAEIAGCPAPRQKALARYGRLFGLAFQLWDDINDTPDEKEKAQLRRKLSNNLARLRRTGREREIDSPLLDHLLEFLAGALSGADGPAD